MDRNNYSKVVGAGEMARLERRAVERGASAEMFMRAAGRRAALRVRERLFEGARVVVLVGKGNKGGDGYVVGRELLGWGYRVAALRVGGGCSELNQRMKDEFVDAGGELVGGVEWGTVDLIVDGLLGTGFEGVVSGEMAELIEAANGSGKPIVAIDLPSGLNGTTGEGVGAIRAVETVGLGLAKMGCFIGDGWKCTGKFVLEDFGLGEEAEREARELGWIPKLERFRLPPMERTQHKYERGFVLGFGGSEALKGAVKLSGNAALHAGAGIVKLFYMEEIGPVADELIAQRWNGDDWKLGLKRAQAVFVGPGMGRSREAEEWLKEELGAIEQPCVLDADALYFLNGIKKWPKRCVLTPHRGEMNRLLGEGEGDFLARCQEFVEEKRVVLVLKGAPTFVLSAGERPVIVPRGDPGMATAGSGDVLTGVIAALLARGMELLEAAVLGVAIHAIAGESAAEEKTSYGYSANDLIGHLPRALKCFLHG